MNNDNYQRDKKLTLWSLRLDRLITAGAVLVALLASIVALVRGTEIQTVLVPPEITRPMWIGKDKVSAEYLEDMAMFMSALIFNVTPLGAEIQGDKLKRYICAEGYGEIDALIRQGTERLKRDGASTTFSPRQLKTEALIKRVTMPGQLNVYIGEKRVSEASKTYVMDFENRTGKLCVKAIYEQQTKPQTDDAGDSAPAAGNKP
jgi:conjugal transfer pilus assembly protein TraE